MSNQPTPSDSAKLPIIFVHGNGDNASIWQNVVWRFESNGWPRDRLFAMDMPYPLARNDDSKPQEGRSGTQDQLAALTQEIARVRKVTGASRVILIGNSRGGYAIRNYLRNVPEGRAQVASVVLGGVPNHGVWKGSFNPGSEFNGAGPFLSTLNSPEPGGPTGIETPPGVPLMTLRSDYNDKFAQPKGVWIGQPTLDTGVSFDGPALGGADNRVLPGRDHREVSFGPEAFSQTLQFLSHRIPRSGDIAPESKVTLNGRIAGYVGADVTNIGLRGAKLSVFEVKPESGERIGAAVLTKVVAADGVWGPLVTTPNQYLEFVIEATGFATTHVYRSPFPRSSSIVHLRPVRMVDADKGAYAVVTMNRSRGYFGVGRDNMSLAGSTTLPGVSPGVAGVSSSKIKLSGPQDSVVASFNRERIAVKPWPLAENRVVIADLSY